LGELQERITLEELHIWNAFYVWRQEEEKKAEERARKSRR
tara:strand:+ start:881 stop:1000 length:120 start_codon:yes stop_codon:yes gene_type:complete